MGRNIRITKGKNATIYFPPAASERIELDLVALTENIVKRKLGDNFGGGLGGLYGYGTDYENSTFKMHPFCWCEERNCPYCFGGEQNFLHKLSGLKIWWYKWIGRDMEYYYREKKCAPSESVWKIIFDECLKSVSEGGEKMTCPNCGYLSSRGGSVMRNFIARAAARRGRGRGKDV